MSSARSTRDVTIQNGSSVSTALRVSDKTKPPMTVAKIIANRYAMRSNHAL